MSRNGTTMTLAVEKFLSTRSCGSGVYVERDETQPTMEALRWVTEIRALLGLDPVAGEETLPFIAACLRSADAYAISPDHPEPALNATYYAARVLVLADAARHIARGMARWLADIAFGPHGNVRLDVDDLFYAMRALECAGAVLSPEEARRLVLFLQACADPGGGFALMPGERPDIERTYCCAMMLKLLGAWDEPQRHREFVAGTIRNGLFHWRPDAAARSLATQYWGIRAAGLCGIRPPWEPVREYAAGAQNPDGGFGGRDGRSTLWHTYCALRVRHLCQEKAMS